MLLPGFIGGAYQAQSSIVDAEECINLFVEVEQVLGQEQPRAALYRDPGLRTFATAGAGPVRGFFEQDGRVWVASGTNVYEMNRDGTVTLRGAIAPGTGPVMFVSNGGGGNQLMLLANGYVYTQHLTTNAFAIVADPDLPNGRIASIGFIDGYGLAHVRDTAQFYISALEDFTSWDPTDIFQKSRTSDNVRVLVVLLGQAWLFGSRTIEPWEDTGDAQTPFQPVPGVVLMQGIVSTDAWTAIEGTVYFVSEAEDGGRCAYQARGFQPQRISTHAVEAIWRTYGDLTDVTMWDYSHQGHPCVQIDFPTQGISWVYDTHTTLWHKRGRWNERTGTFDAHLGRCHVYAFGSKHLVGSRIDGKVYEQTADAYDDAGTPQRWVRRAPALASELRNIVHGRFWVDAEVGTTPLWTGQGSDPRLMLRYSDSAGKQWSKEIWRSIGKQGVYGQRTIWNKLGLARGPHGRIYELSGTDPVPIALHAAGVDIGRAA